MRKIALYIRVSTAEQAENEEGSLKSQEQRLREYVNRRNETEPWGEIVGIFIERGKSGKDTNRPELQRMFKGIRQRCFNLILCSEISRLSRSTRDFCNLLELLKEHDCQILSLREQFDTTTAAGEMMMYMLMNFAQFERKQIGERVKANLRARSQRGLFNGGFVPFGYNLHPTQKGHLVVNLEEAQTIRACFDTFLRFGSLSAAAKELNRKGYSPKKKGGGSRTGPEHFVIQLLYRILTNPTYVGKKKFRENDKTLLANAKWEAIIPQETFDAVQERLSRNKSRLKPDSCKKHPYLLTGLLWCGLCGEPMVGKSSWGRHKVKHLYYAHGTQVTRNHTTDRPGCRCSVGQVRALRLEESMIDRIKQMLVKEEMVRAFLEEAKESGKARELLDNLAIHKKLVFENASRIDSVMKHIEALPAGATSKTFYERLIALEKERERLNENVQLLQTELSTQAEVLTPEEYLQFVGDLFNNFDSAPTETKKQLLRALIHKISVYPEQMEISYYVGTDCVPRRENSGAHSLTFGVPKGIRTPVTSVKGRCPGPG